MYNDDEFVKRIEAVQRQILKNQLSQIKFTAEPVLTFVEVYRERGIKARKGNVIYVNFSGRKR